MMNSQTNICLTGPQLQAARRARGISQAAMGKAIGCSRHGVSYWEMKTAPFTIRRGIPVKMLRALGVLPINLLSLCAHGGGPTKDTSTRRRGDGVLPPEAFLNLTVREQERLARECARISAKAASKAARHRQICEARTRKRNGAPCRNKSEPGRRRCKFHGGMSTGPKTAEGRARIAEAQRRRWTTFRASKQKHSIKHLGPQS